MAERTVRVTVEYEFPVTDKERGKMSARTYAEQSFHLHDSEITDVSSEYVSQDSTYEY